MNDNGKVSCARAECLMHIWLVKSVIFPSARRMIEGRICTGFYTRSRYLIGNIEKQTYGARRVFEAIKDDI